MREMMQNQIFTFPRVLTYNKNTDNVIIQKRLIYQYLKSASNFVNIYKL